MNATITKRGKKIHVKFPTGAEFVTSEIESACQLQAAWDLAEAIEEHYGESIDKDEDISGCDAVDSISCYVELARYAMDLPHPRYEKEKE